MESDSLIEKYEITETLQERIKKRQQVCKLTQKEVATNICKSIDQYKNILKKCKGRTQQFVPQATLHDIAICLGCTVDYLIGESEDPKRHKDGSPFNPRQPISFDEHNKLVKTVTQQLTNNNNELLRNLYFLFTSVEKTTSENIIKAFNTLITPLRDHSYLTDTLGFSQEEMGYLKAAYSPYAEKRARLSIKLAKGNEKVNNHRFKEACCIYLQIILSGELETHDLICKAINEICSLKTNKTWVPFPKEIESLLPAFMEIYDKKHRFLKDEEKEQIENYLKKSMKRKEH